MKKMIVCLSVSLLGSLPLGALPADNYPKAKPRPKMTRVVRPQASLPTNPQVLPRMQAVEVEAWSPPVAQPSGGIVPTYDKVPGLSRHTPAENWNSRVPGIANPPGTRLPTALSPFGPSSTSPTQPDRAVSNTGTTSPTQRSPLTPSPTAPTPYGAGPVAPPEGSPAGPETPEAAGR